MPVSEFMPVSTGNEVSLLVKGKLNDDIYFIGADVVRIIDKGK